MKINRNSKLFIAATALSRFGSVILSIFFNYWIVSQGKSATFLGTLTGLMYIPNIILSFVAGSLADRYQKKKLLIIFDSTSFLISLFCFLYLSINSNNSSILIVSSLVLILLNSLAALYGPTSRSLVPSMVEKDGIPKFNIIYTIFADCIKFIAPLALIIPFILALNLKDFFLLNSVSFFLSIILTNQIDGDINIKVLKKARIRIPIKEILASPQLITVIVLFFTVNLILSSFGITLPLLCKNFIGMKHYPNLIMYQSLSSLIFSLFFLFKRKIRSSTNRIMNSSLVLSISLILIALSPTPIFVYSACVIIGAFNSYFSITFFSVIQSNDEINKISGIYGLISAISLIAVPIGSFTSGVLYDILGAQSLIIFGCFIIIMNILGRKQL